MAGIKALRKLQYGKETTAGTAVAATAVWRGIGTIQDDLETVFPTEDIGILTGTDRSYIPRVEAQLSLDSTEATYEQLPVLFNSGIRGVGSTGTWDMAFGSSDVITSTSLYTYTWEGGDNQQAEKFAYGFCRSFNLSGDAGGALMMSAEMVGRQVTTAAYTTGVAVTAVEEILFSKGVLSIGGAMPYPATATKSNTLLTMNLAVNTGLVPVYTASGQLYFSFIKMIVPEVVWSITFEHDATSVAEIAAWRAGTPRSVSVKFTGSGNKALTLAAVGKWDNFEKLGERDGNDIVTGNFRARYNATAGGMFRVILA